MITHTHTHTHTHTEYEYKEGEDVTGRDFAVGHHHWLCEVWRSGWCAHRISSRLQWWPATLRTTIEALGAGPLDMRSD